MPYPSVLCLSVNETIVHGIPDKRRLESGDLLSIDCAVSVAGYHADAAITVGIGKLDAEGQRLATLVVEALERGIAQMCVGARLGDVSAAIEQVIRAAGLGTPEGYGGHGVGRAIARGAARGEHGSGADGHDAARRARVGD